MKIKWIITLWLVILASSCSEEQDCCVPLPIDPSKVNLSSPEIGQKTTYWRYTTTCADVNGDFQYTGDKLILEVVNVNDQLSFQESLTEDSPMYQAGAFQEPIQYPVTVTDGKLIMPERWESALFFFYANDVLTLEPNHDVILQQDACKLLQNTDPFIGNDIGILPAFKVGPLENEGKTAVSCEPFFNLDAYLIYDAIQLNMSHVITFGNAPNEEVVSGWVLAKDE